MSAFIRVPLLIGEGDVMIAVGAIVRALPLPNGTSILVNQQGEILIGLSLDQVVAVIEMAIKTQTVVTWVTA